MSAVCPNGHTSGAEDFCDTCGAKIDLENQPEAAAAPEPEAAVGAGSSSAGESGSAAVAAPEQQVCPNAAPTPRTRCSARRAGTTSRPAPCRGAHRPGPARRRPTVRPLQGVPRFDRPGDPARVVAEVWSTRSGTRSRRPRRRCRRRVCPPVGLTARSLLIGRVSPSNIHPDIDCTSDTGASRHAQLTTDGQRWFVEDPARRTGRSGRVGTVAGGPDRRGATDRA
jgi:hypothetical protein